MAAALVSCDRDDVEDVSFNVSAPQTVVAGQPITFSFDGNPDYITFFSGEPDNCYENRNRTRLSEVAGMNLSFYCRMMYAENRDYLNKQVLRVMISTDYDGSGNIDPTQWRDLTDPAQSPDGKYLEPLVLKSSTVVELPSSSIDLSAYKDGDFYLAFRYDCPPHTGVSSKDDSYNYDNRPRVEVNTIRLEKTEPGGKSHLNEDLLNEFGFRTIFVNSRTETSFVVGNYRMLLQGQEYYTEENGTIVDIDQNYNMDVWVVSKKLNAADVNPDTGTAVKASNARVPVFQHTYTEPGTYKAAFVATNANKWNSTSTVREITVQVLPAQ